MRRRLAWSVVAVLAAVAASAEDPAAALARGKLEADLGHQAVAAEAFASVAKEPGASGPQRWEALVRLGVARREAGDAGGSVDAFEEAYRSYGKDPEALRFLLEAVGSALPGRERWEEVWRQVTVDVDRRVAEHPEVRVTWPGLPFGLCPCSGAPITLDLEGADLQDVFRLFADISGLNVVVQPGTRGLVTYHASKVPWDEVLERLLAPNGLVAEVRGNVLRIGRPSDVAPAREAGQTRTFTGAPISFAFEKKDLVEVLREIAAHGQATVEIPEGVTGWVTFRLNEVPWDQAFDLATRVNGLVWTRTGNVIRVEPQRREPSR
jgi:hypothetical protein